MGAHIHTLPELEWVETKAFSSRRGAIPKLLVIHRWSGGSYTGVESWFENPKDDASSHFVYAGETGRYAGRCAQMVRLSDAAWTEAFWNSHSVSIECADAIWLGQDPAGFVRLGRICGWLCKHLGIEPDWIRGSELLRRANGICRHGDLGSAGGNHLECPTTDLEKFHQLGARTRYELARDGYRDHWAR